MSAHLSTHERFKRMYEHRAADRVPIMDSPWNSTLERWTAEGMPDRDYVGYFDLDRVGSIGVDNSPRYPYQVLEETDEYIISKSAWGATMKNWKHMASTPEFLDFTITSPKAWEEAKARMTADDDRIPWDYLKKNYPIWKKNDLWIIGNFWFGFDVTHSWAVGTTRLLMAMIEDPEWCVDMFNHYLDVDIALMDKVWDAGYHFDEITWPDDMGYKHNQFFSLKMYRELLKPVHRRAVEWAHKKGIKARMHSCGDVNPFVPELIDIGMDGLNPLEVKAGMNPVELKAKYGDKLVFHGGINAVLWNQPEKIIAEINRVVPAMKQHGGYIFASDHSIPDTVSLKEFELIINAAKTAGSYE